MAGRPLNTLVQLREKLVQLRRSSADKLIGADALSKAEMAQLMDTCRQIEMLDRAISDEERLAGESEVVRAAQRPATEKLTRVELLERETRDKQSRTDRTQG